MPHKASVSEAWGSKRGSMLAYGRLLVSALSFLASLGIRQAASSSGTIAVWTAWFIATAFAMVACVFAAEVAFKVRASAKDDRASFIMAIARAAMWFAVLRIGHLALVAFFRIVSPLG